MQITLSGAKQNWTKPKWNCCSVEIAQMMRRKENMNRISCSISNVTDMWNTPRKQQVVGLLHYLSGKKTHTVSSHYFSKQQQVAAIPFGFQVFPLANQWFRGLLDDKYCTCYNLYRYLPLTPLSNQRRNIFRARRLALITPPAFTGLTNGGTRWRQRLTTLTSPDPRPSVTYKGSKRAPPTIRNLSLTKMVHIFWYIPCVVTVTAFRNCFVIQAQVPHFWT